MIISLFTFGISWGLYAFAFYAITRVLPQFHSSYRESTFTVAFTLGFLQAAFLKGIRVMNFKVHPIVLFIVSMLFNVLLILATSGMADTYYVTGHKGPVIAASLLALLMVLFELIKVKFFSDLRL